MRGLCAACGRRSHRYGTTDPNHAYDGVACVNGLRWEIRTLREGMREARNEISRLFEVEATTDLRAHLSGNGHPEDKIRVILADALKKSAEQEIPRE